MPLHCFEPHFICHRLFAGKNVRSLQIGIDHEKDCFVTGQFLDLCRDGFKSGKLARLNAAMPGNGLVPSVFFLAERDRCDHAPLLDAFHKLIHVLVHTDLERMIGELVNFRDRNGIDARETILHSFLLVHEQLVVVVQSEVNRLTRFRCHKTAPRRSGLRMQRQLCRTDYDGKCSCLCCCTQQPLRNGE